MNNYIFLDELKNKIIKFIYDEDYTNYKYINLDHSNEYVFHIEDEEFEIDNFIIFVTFDVEIVTNTDAGDYYTPSYVHISSEYINITSIIYYDDEEIEHKIPYKIVKKFENDINNALY